jgi:hypothetical protein
MGTGGERYRWWFSYLATPSSDEKRFLQADAPCSWESRKFLVHLAPTTCYLSWELVMVLVSRHYLAPEYDGVPQLTQAEIVQRRVVNSMNVCTEPCLCENYPVRLAFISLIDSWPPWFPIHHIVSSPSCALIGFEGTLWRCCMKIATKFDSEPSPRYVNLLLPQNDPRSLNEKYSQGLGFLALLHVSTLSATAEIHACHWCLPSLDATTCYEIAKVNDACSLGALRASMAHDDWLFPDSPIGIWRSRYTEI